MPESCKSYWQNWTPDVRAYGGLEMWMGVKLWRAMPLSSATPGKDDIVLRLPSPSPTFPPASVLFKAYAKYLHKTRRFIVCPVWAGTPISQGAEGSGWALQRGGVDCTVSSSLRALNKVKGVAIPAAQLRRVPFQGFADRSSAYVRCVEISLHEEKAGKP